jgi:TonB family protein
MRNWWSRSIGRGTSWRRGSPGHRRSPSSAPGCWTPCGARSSARALAALPAELPGETTELGIRVFGTGSRLPAPVDTAAPVFTIAEPRFVVTRVDAAAQPIPVTGPQYPIELRRAGVAGIVEMQFIVNAAGRIEPASARVVFESHPAFTASIREAMPRLRFVPARIGDCATRSWVRQRFEFRLGG